MVAAAMCCVHALCSCGATVLHSTRCYSIVICCGQAVSMYLQMQMQSSTSSDCQWHGMTIAWCKYLKSAAHTKVLLLECRCALSSVLATHASTLPPFVRFAHPCAAFGEVKKRVRTTAGGSTGSVRNLRIREDTAKYLLNLDTNSAHYDPKSRSMREDPNPNRVSRTGAQAIVLGWRVCALVCVCWETT
jgi:hypothetical protein